MLGITTPDAIAFGMMILAALAAWQGSKSGGNRKSQEIKSAPFVSIAGSIVDANQFSDFVKVLDKGAIAMAQLAEAINHSHEVKYTNALEELADKIDHIRDQKRKP